MEQICVFTVFVLKRYEIYKPELQEEQPQLNSPVSNGDLNWT